MVAHFSVSGVGQQSDAAVWGTVFCPAKAMGPAQRQDLAVRALAAMEPVCRLAAEHGVSRKFVSGQVDRAEAALQQAFDPEPDGTAEVLFYLPVTKAWIEQAALVPSGGSGAGFDIVVIPRAPLVDASLEAITADFRDILNRHAKRARA